MLTFKSQSDLSQLSPSNPAYPVMKELVEQLIDAYTTPGCNYDADAYGYCVLQEVLWEGALKKDGFYIAIVLWNDDAGLTVTIPDAPWVKGELRELPDELVAC